MDMTNPELFDDQVFAAAQHILTTAEGDFERPADALIAHLLAVAVMAQAVGLSLPSLLRGVTAAYNDLVRQDEEDKQ
jgi:hypothetical protein